MPSDSYGQGLAELEAACEHRKKELKVDTGSGSIYHQATKWNRQPFGFSPT